MSIVLPPLPYEYKALEPYISEQSLRFHHDKHFAKYVNTTNSIISGTDLENADLLTIMKAAKEKGDMKLYNNAAQSLNHDFSFKCLKHGGGGQPKPGKLLELINKHFGSFADFREQFEAACNSPFASGYGWLVLSQDGMNKLKVMSSADADNPITMDDGGIPLLAIDVWEHAYYLDTQNLRSKYVSNVMNHLVNWDFVESQLPKN